MSFYRREQSRENSARLHIFQKKFNYQNNHKKPSTDANAMSRIEVLSMPTVRQLVSTWYSSARYPNGKVFNSVQKTFRSVLNAKKRLTNCNDDYIKQFMPKPQSDPDKFSRKDMNNPIFYETYLRYYAKPNPRGRVFGRKSPKGLSYCRAVNCNYQNNRRYVRF